VKVSGRSQAVEATVGSLFWTAFGLGIAFCVPPGAVAVEALRRGIHRGFTGALFVQLGSLVGDAAWAILGLSGVARLATSRQASVVLGTAGVLLLLGLAARALVDAWTGTLPRPKDVSARGDFAAGAVLSLSNPFAIAFWVSLGGTVGMLAPDHPGQPALVVFFAAFMLAAFLWCFFSAAVIAWGRRLLQSTVYRWTNVACAAALVYFAVRFLIPVLRSLGAFGMR
jgi:chemosensory pili system protein ChpE